MLTAPTIARPIRLAELPRPRREPAVGNVPGEVNVFVGRDRELSRLREVQAEARMLSLVGPGGVGKTRLAVRLGAQVRGAFADGAWLVDLSPVADPALVPQVVGDALGVHLQPGHSWLSELTRALRTRRLLLVLDNCEHLITACAELVDGLLPSCPDLRLVATSQQPLGVAGETIWRVGPLSVPPATTSTVSELEANEAVQLFVARVCAHQPDFAFGAHNALVIADICRRLDGLPLALELVAARVATLGVTEAAARLSDRFALAIGRNRTAAARRQTLQAALDWSFSLLSIDELRLLRRLSVFVGGWTLEAAETVCAGDQASTEPRVVDTLDQLIAKSLVVADHGELSVRYRLLDTVRAYASGQLEGVNEAAALRRRHAEFMAQLSERSPPERFHTAHAALLKPEEDNMRAALEWANQQDAGELGLRLAVGAFRLWLHSGHYREGNSWCERVLQLPSVASTTTPARALTLLVHAQLLVFMGDYQLAEARGQAGYEEHVRRADARGIALALAVLGNVALQRGDLVQARVKHAAAAQQLREAGSPGDASSLLQSGHIACELMDLEVAHRLIVEIKDIARARHEPLIEGALVNLKGLVAAAEGDAAIAAGFFEEALVLRRVAWDQQGIVRTMTSLGHARLDLGQISAAVEAFHEALRYARASGERVRIIRALEGCARCITDADAAVRLAGATDRARRALGAELWPSERRYLEGWLARARRALGSSAYQRAWEDGHASTLDQAISMAEAFKSQPAPAESAASALSPREREVAVLLAHGLTNKQIAAALVVSPATVRSHVEHILAKLDLHSRAQIGVWASQQGLLPQPVLEVTPSTSV